MSLFGRYASHTYGSAATVLYSTLGGCLLLAVVLPSMTGPLVFPSSARAWWLLIVFGAATIALAQFLYFDALSRISASRVSMATAAEPVVAGILATLLLGQGLEPVGWLGIVMVVAGVAGVGLVGGPRSANDGEPVGA